MDSHIQQPITLDSHIQQSSTNIYEPVKPSAQRRRHSPELIQKKQDLRDTMKKFHKACFQLNLLNQRCVELNTRMERAKRDQMTILLANLSRKMSVLQGVKQMFYEYVYTTSDDVMMLRNEVRVMLKKAQVDN